MEEGVVTIHQAAGKEVERVGREELVMAGVAGNQGKEGVGLLHHLPDEIKKIPGKGRKARCHLIDKPVNLPDAGAQDPVES